MTDQRRAFEPTVTTYRNSGEQMEHVFLRVGEGRIAETRIMPSYPLIHLAIGESGELVGLSVFGDGDVESSGPRLAEQQRQIEEAEFGFLIGQIVENARTQGEALHFVLSAIKRRRQGTRDGAYGALGALCARKARALEWETSND